MAVNEMTDRICAGKNNELSSASPFLEGHIREAAKANELCR
jgi:hypothetical protein